MADPETLLRHHRDRLMATGLGWVRKARRFQKVFNVLCILGGGLIGAIGGGMEGAMTPSSGAGLTIKGICVCLGSLLVFVGGFVILILQDEGPELLARAASLEAAAQTYLDEKQSLLLRLGSLSDLDRKRLALIEANKVMRETLEHALLTPAANLAGTAQLMIDAALRLVTTSIGFGADEKWAISVFQVIGTGEQAELRRVAARRADRLDEQNQPRSWRRNEGFVGQAWSTETAIIIADGSQPDALDQFNVPHEKQRPYDADRYRSMAAIPVRLGEPAEIWGVVAVSSDCPQRFRRDPGNKAVQAVDTVRLIARMNGLMAAAFRRSEH